MNVSGGGGGGLFEVGGGEMEWGTLLGDRFLVCDLEGIAFRRI